MLLKGKRGSVVAYSQTGFQFRSLLLDLLVQVSENSLRNLRLVEIVGPTFRLTFSVGFGHCLVVERLADEPFAYEFVRIVSEANIEISLRLPLIYLFNKVENLLVNVHNVGSLGLSVNKVLLVHFERIFYFNLNIVAGGALFGTIRCLLDCMMKNERIRLLEKWMKALRNLHEFHSLRAETLLQEEIVVDSIAIDRILQFVGLDVLPERLDNLGTGLVRNAENFGQTRMQLESHRLVVEQKKNRTFDGAIARALDLESISLARSRSSVPLDKMIVRSVDVFIQLDDETLKEGAELLFRQLSWRLGRCV